MGNTQSKTKENNTKTGDTGELLAVNYLQNKGFAIIDQQYQKKWGEIDIVAQKGAKIHFVEVKSVTHETKQQLEQAVSHETWQPEDQVHKHKQRQLARIVETWMMEQNYTGKIQIDVAVVRIVPRETYATVKIIENVIFD